MSVRGGRRRGGGHPLKNGLTAGTKSLSVWNPPPRRGFWVDSIVFAALYIVRFWPRLKRLGLRCAFSVVRGAPEACHLSVAEASWLHTQ